MKELTLTKGRHEIKSVITGEIVEDSIFGNTVDDVLNVKQHMATATTILRKVADNDILIYVTGLTPLFQAVFAAWLELNCSGYANASLDMPRGSLTFAHYDRNTGTYVLADSLSGDSGVDLDWYP